MLKQVADTHGRMFSKKTDILRRQEQIFGQLFKLTSTAHEFTISRISPALK